MTTYLLCLALSPVAIAVLLGYSHLKRYTEATHVVLGIALGIAPLGAWIAVRGALEGLPVFLAMGVAFWTGGFDLLYSCLDVAFDRREGLRSIPARIGIGPALRVAALFHGVSVLGMALFLFESQLGGWSWASLVVVSLLLLVEHRLVRPDDLSRLGPAFFTFNAMVSLVFLGGCAMDLLGG